MRGLLRHLPLVSLAVLLVACVLGAFLTGGAGSIQTPAKAPDAGNQAAGVDNQLVQTARQLASLADTSDEQALAGEALRLTDHDLDQAFATALREAAAVPPPASGPFKQLADRLAQAKARVASDQAHLAQLAQKDAASEQVELAKAQLALDQDQLDDAQQDLARQGGDRHARLERALQEHEALQHTMAQPLKFPAPAPTETLWDRMQASLALRDRRRQLLGAQQQAARKAGALEREHNTLEALLNHKEPAATSAATDEVGKTAETEDTTALVARLRHLSDQRKTLTELDKRILDIHQLADVYQRWNSSAAARQRGVLHLLLRSLAGVFAVLLAMVLMGRAIRRAFGNRTDRRRLHQLRVMATIAVQVLGVLLILLITFGPPNQTPTIIGLATAGLTVALKDFIVAFFGWFVLMGRNGIRVGDWVEIEGVGGEVVEIGLLRTMLLEMGNWTGTGLPTGRRVAFVNSFALEGHYFNFSTAGQWLWDVLQVSLPPAGDPYQLAQQIRETVERETETDASLAEQGWERVTRQYGIRPFSAKPAVDLRPSAGGLEVIVRYITRAPQRYELKARLFHQIVDLLHKPASAEQVSP